ncbi:MAG: LamG-like jellyroll fold domain-containing protein, partial [Saprospiraceae bacterium]
VSHGSWQNRWKLSITPEGFPRWTVNTLNSIIDLDATQPMQKDDKYFLTATYDGKTMVMYVNGELVSFKNQTGKIRQSNIPMLIGQILPDDPQYNFAGLIDEVKIYNYALQPQTVKQNYLDASLSTDEEIAKLSGIKLFPNPGNSELNILFTNKLFSGEISILDISGRVYRRIKTSEINKLDLNVSELNSGIYLIKFTSKDAVAVEKWMKI